MLTPPSDRPAAGFILIVSGPPGAGKSTVARWLAQTWGGPAVHVPTDAFYNAILSGYVAPWLAEAHQQNITVTQAIAAAAAAYAAGGYAVMLDGVVGPWFVERYREAAASAGVELSYVVLRPDRATAVFRARDREEMPLIDYPEGLFERFDDLGPFTSHVIDTTSLEVAAVADLVREGLAESRFHIESAKRA
jgi:adenylate kinase family enzyme